MTEITECQFCGKKHGVRCPSVKAIEYHKNGTVRRVEFMTAADYPAAEFDHKFEYPQYTFIPAPSVR